MTKRPEANHPKLAQINEAVARTALEELCPSTRVLDIRPGPASYSNHLWVANTDEGQMLIRFPGRDTQPEYIRGGLAASRLAAEAGVPAPRLRAFAENSTAGTPVVVQEYHTGQKATELLESAPSALADIATSLGHWVGTLHGVHGSGFGSVLSPATHLNWGEMVRSRVDNALRSVEPEALPAPAGDIQERFEALLQGVTTEVRPSLVHGDLYFDNVLARNGAAVTLLDFEHAWFADRFADFGKINELLFEWWPSSREPFLASYHTHVAREENDGVRHDIALGLYELSQIAYFQKWQGDLVPVYRERLQRWLVER